MSETARRDVFQAIADPTRRRILELLSNQPGTINELAEEMDMSQPAISQQVKILSECQLIDVEQVGRQRFCKIRNGSLVPAFMWLEQLEKQWTRRVDSFETYINSVHPTKKKSKK